MEVLGRRHFMTYFDRHDPLMGDHFLNGQPMLRIWFQHLANQTAACARVEVVDRWWAGRHRHVSVRTCCRVRTVQGI